MRGAPIDLSEIPNFADQIRPALEGMRSQFPALASAPRMHAFCPAESGSTKSLASELTW